MTFIGLRHNILHMQKKVLVIGHTGFIGRTIIDNLKERKVKFEGIASQNCDLRKPHSINYLAKKFNKNIILVIAAAINRELGDNLNSMQTNISMISHIAQALEKKPVEKCIYLSTADVYGRPDKLPITEQTLIKPLTYYAMAKYTGEQILQITCQKNNIPFLVLRYNGVFGPGQRNIGYGPNYFIHEIKKNGLVKIWGNGWELRDTVYVKDLAKIIIKLSLNSTTGIYNIATGQSHSFTNILKMIRPLSTTKFQLIKQKRTSPPFNQIFDTSKLKKVNTKISFTPLAKALGETYNAADD